MADFKIKIAGCTVQVQALFDSTRDYCRAYLTEDAAEFSVAVTRADMEFEQAWLDEEARQEGLRRRKFSDPFLERSAIQRMTAEKLLSRDVLLVHGSTVAVDGEGYLFTAGCGTGKSTHTRLWREVFGDRAVMVNDDKPFLRIGEEGIFACGAPWSGKHGLDTNITVPLRGICILERGGKTVSEGSKPGRRWPCSCTRAANPGRKRSCPGFTGWCRPWRKERPCGKWNAPGIRQRRKCPLGPCPAEMGIHEHPRRSGNAAPVFCRLFRFSRHGGETKCAFAQQCIDGGWKAWYNKSVKNAEDVLTYLLSW